MFDEDHDENDQVPEAYREPDPEADLPDPESELAPSVDVPDPESDLVPSVDVPDLDPAAVDDALLQSFWVTVLVVNAALLSLSVGLLMVAFGVRRPLGAGVVVLGLLLARRGYRLYRDLDDRHRDGAFDPPETADSDGQEREARDGPASPDAVTEDEAGERNG